MFGKQIYKSSLDRTLLGKRQVPQTNVYDKDELTKLFELEPDGKCDSLKHFQQSHSGTSQNVCSITENNPLVVGISQRNAIYKDIPNPDNTSKNTT